MARLSLVLPVFVGRSEPRIIGLKASVDEIEALRASQKRASSSTATPT